MAIKKSKQTKKSIQAKRPAVKGKKSDIKMEKVNKSNKAKSITKIAKTTPTTKPKPAGKPVAIKITKTPAAPKTAKGSSREPLAKTKKDLSPRGKEIHKIRQKLLMQRASLLAEAEQALNSLPGQTIFPDLGDQASAEIDRNFMLRLRGREQKLLKKIDSSIEKIDNGSFGTCEVCGQDIDLKRLEVRPVTTMCIQCKLEQEEEEKLRGT